jgi:hypothetical protein
MNRRKNIIISNSPSTSLSRLSILCDILKKINVDDTFNIKNSFKFKSLSQRIQKSRNILRWLRFFSSNFYFQWYFLPTKLWPGHRTVSIQCSIRPGIQISMTLKSQTWKNISLHFYSNMLMSHWHASTLNLFLQP